MSPSLKRLLTDQNTQRFIFHPEQDFFDDPFVVKIGNVHISCYKGACIEGRKTVVHFHGNGETVAEYQNLFPKLLEEIELDCFLSEYRGYSMSNGAPSLLNIITDVEVIIKSLNINESDLIFWGRSLGTIPAIHAASIFQSAHGIVLESPIPDLYDFFARRSSSIIWRFDEALSNELRCFHNVEEKLRNFNGRSLIVHAEDDTLNPISNGYETFKSIRQKKRLLTLPNCDHNSIMTTHLVEYMQAVYQLAHACEFDD